MDSLYVHIFTSPSAKFLVQEPDHYHRIQEDVGVKGQILKKTATDKLYGFMGEAGEGSTNVHRREYHRI